MQDPAIDRAADLLRGARRVVVLTGAGISTDSGIPDFRGPEGVWTKDPDAEMLSNYDVWMTRPDVRAKGWASRVDSIVWRAEPNDGHRAITAMDRAGRLDLLVTQNIDRLHHAAGTDPDRIVEIHGNAHESVCMSCGARLPMQITLDRVIAGDPDPACDAGGGVPCRGILKSATISFGQGLVPEDLDRSEVAAQGGDLMLCVGSTLAVFPVAGIVPIAAAAGVPIVIINGEETAMDPLADVIIRGDITAALVSMVAGLSPVG
jgi:NAD-dependent deacetylase